MARRPSSGSVGPALAREHPRVNGSADSNATKRPIGQLFDTPRPPLASRSNTSMSQKLDSLVILHNNPDDLLARHTISEVKAVQQRLRADADAKQEELRLMVGERYRDLLQSSTSILALAKSSRNVLGALGEMQDTVSAISPARPRKRISTLEDKHLQVLQSLAAHVKLLLDAPEHLWRLMEKKAYLNAAWLCLVARVVHRALSQDDDDQSWRTYGIDVMEQFPLVQRQWDAIIPFRSQISHKATLFLREATSTPGEVCATLISLHLLDSRPLPETLSIYLAQRTKTLSSILICRASKPLNGEYKPSERVALRARKLAVRETKQKAEATLDAICRTVCTARVTFANNASGQPSLMKQALSFFQAPSEHPGSLPWELQLSTHSLLDVLPSAAQLLLLPQSIRNYKPYIDGSSISEPTLQPRLQVELDSWFRKAIQDTKGAFADWFAALNSVQEVWELRSALLTWLKGTQGLNSIEGGQLEAIVNVTSQQRATSVWKAALRSLETSFNDAVSSATTSLEQDTGEHRYDIHPVEHLFHAASIPSVIQTGTQSSVVAAQFAKYKSALRQQLVCRTPLLHSTLTILEQRGLDLQNDIANMSQPDEGDSDLVAKMYSSYCADAEDTCQNICASLENVVSNEGTSVNTSVFIGRICQELASSSDFFARLGCNPTVVDSFRQRLNTLHNTLMERWQQHTVAHVLAVESGDGSHHTRSRITEDTSIPARPSHSLIQALLLLSSKVQDLGIYLEEDRRQQQAGSTLQCFIISFLERLEKDASPPEHSVPQMVWDMTFLQTLHQLWGIDAVGISERIDASIARRRDLLVGARSPSQEEISSSTLEYLARVQILLGGLLPSHTVTQGPGTVSTKGEKPLTLLHHGTPAVEQRFEPALELVKTPPRFGLLLIGGGATIR